MYRITLSKIVVFLGVSILWVNPNPSSAATIVGTVTNCEEGVSGYEIVAHEEVMTGYWWDFRCQKETEDNVLETVVTDDDGNFSISYTPQTDPGGTCDYSNLIYVKVYYGGDLILTSGKRTAGGIDRFNIELSSPRDCTPVCEFDMDANYTVRGTAYEGCPELGNLPLSDFLIDIYAVFWKWNSVTSETENVDMFVGRVWTGSDGSFSRTFKPSNYMPTPGEGWEIISTIVWTSFVVIDPVTDEAVESESELIVPDLCTHVYEPEIVVPYLVTGSMRVYGTDKDQGLPPVQLNQFIAADVLGGETIRIIGANLGDHLEVSLYQLDSSGFYPARIVAVDQIDGGWIEVEVPEVPLPQSAGSNWGWIVSDPRGLPCLKKFDVVRPFTILDHPYPVIYGLGFKNEKDDATWDEFLAVYDKKAYICVGALGVCVKHVLNPFYLAWYKGVYKNWVNSSDGSCVGMSGTSLLMRFGDIDPRDFDPDVNYAAGFSSPGKPAEWITYGGWRWTPDRRKPGNLWAEIRKNHGVQTSLEFIREFLNDTSAALSWPPYKGHPNDRLSEVRTQPLWQMIAMTDGEEGGGHAVTPYAVTDYPLSEVSTILVYDNNDPRDLTRTIEVYTDLDSYYFANSAGGKIRQGNRMVTYPLELWRESRSMPGISDLLGMSINFLFLGGGASGLYTTSDGGQVGWDADGNVVHTTDMAATLVPLGQLSEDNHNIPFVFPSGEEPPSIQINSQGGDYTLHAASGGNLIQIEVIDSAAGDTDFVEIKAKGNRLNSLQFVSKDDGTRLIARAGMMLKENAVVMFTWAGLTLPPGGGLELTILNDNRGVGVRYDNLSSTPTSHTLVLESIDGDSENVSTQIFGPFNVPGGAAHTVLIADWPVSSQLQSELDFDRDGDADDIRLVDGMKCGAMSDDGPEQDLNRDGIPDRCHLLPGCNDNANLYPDDSIDALDFAVLAAEYGCTSNCIADIDGDGDTDIADMAIVAANWLCGAN